MMRYGKLHRMQVVLSHETQTWIGGEMLERSAFVASWRHPVILLTSRDQVAVIFPAVIPRKCQGSQLLYPQTSPSRTLQDASPLEPPVRSQVAQHRIDRKDLSWVSAWMLAFIAR